MEVVDVVGISTSIVVAMAAGMVMLWKSNQASLASRIKHTEDKLDKCEEHHQQALDSIVILAERVGNLEGYAKHFPKIKDLL